MIVTAVTLAIMAFIAAHTAILAQFIGTTDGVLATLALVQVLCLLTAGALLAVVVIMRRRDGAVAAGVQRAPRPRLPGWLIFTCVLLIATVLLGEISILIARLEGDHLSNLQHVPTLTVFVACLIFCLAWINKAAGPTT